MLEVETVLVPVDGSEESATAARYAVAIADRYDAAVHVLYVVGETLDRAMSAGDLAAGDVAADNETFLESIRAESEAAGVPVEESCAVGFSTTRKTQHPGSVTLDAAESVAADFLVVPREGTGDVLEKTAEYVLLYASQPVLSV